MVLPLTKYIERERLYYLFYKHEGDRYWTNTKRLHETEPSLWFEYEMSKL